MKISIKGLCFSYDKKEMVLDDVTFTLEGGGTSVLMGLNGSGKTTLLDCMIGFHKADKGSIVIDGKNIREYTEIELAQKISYVPQKTECKINYTVYEYILMGRNPYLKPGHHFTRKDCKTTDDCMEKCGIIHLADKEITRISGGELQLVSLAKALVQNTEFIIMDEPFSALDLSNQSVVMDLISNISTNNKHILLTTHNPNHALHLKGSVLLMKQGRIIEHGPAEKVININVLKQIFGDHICLSRDLPFCEISFKCRT